MTELDEPIHLCTYDQHWPALFASEAQRIAAGLSVNIATEHIGSTAIPGLLAKPIIDVMLGMDSYHSLPTIRSELVALGYEDMGKPAFRGGFTFAAEQQSPPTSRWLCAAAPFG